MCDISAFAAATINDDDANEQKSILSNSEECDEK